MTALQPVTPPALERMVKNCMAKIRTLAGNREDLETELQWIAEGGTGAAEISVVKSGRRERLYGTLAFIFLIAAMVGGVFYWSSFRATAPVLVAEIPPPRNVQFRFSGGLDFQSLALAPDGHAVAFGGLDDRGKIMLWVRPLDAAEAHPTL